MTWDLMFNDTDSIKSVKSLGAHGIEVTVKVDVTIDVLVTKTPGEDEVIAQSTSKANIDVSLTGPNLKVASKSGAFIRNVEAIPTSRRTITVVNTPPGTILKARQYIDQLTLVLTKYILNIFKQHHTVNALPQYIGSEHNEKALDFLSDLATDLVVCVNAMKMKITGNEPSIKVEQCNQFCETQITVTKFVPIANAPRSASNAHANTERAVSRCNLIVTDL